MRWVRGAPCGIEFLQPLPAELMERLAASD